MCLARCDGAAKGLDGHLIMGCALCASGIFASLDLEARASPAASSQSSITSGLPVNCELRGAAAGKMTNEVRHLEGELRSNYPANRELRP